jgi:hypothetical protein
MHAFPPPHFLFHPKMRRADFAAALALAALEVHEPAPLLETL